MKIPKRTLISIEEAEELEVPEGIIIKALENISKLGI